MPRQDEGCPTASSVGNFDESSPIEEQPFDAVKCSQIVVGINAVTRHLEKGNLRAGVVCLSAKPAILQHHLLMLAATRDARLVALPALSETISPNLGVKSALAIGFKVNTPNSDWCFNFVLIFRNQAAMRTTFSLLSKSYPTLPNPYGYLGCVRKRIQKRSQQLKKPIKLEPRQDQQHPPVLLNYMP